MTTSIVDVDYAAQERPFEWWEEIKAELAELFPDRKPTDWLDEKERELEAGRVWVLTQKGK